MESAIRADKIKIAVFDSGVGGLNLLCALAKKLPEAQYFYLADNFNVPYGDKSAEQIFSLVKERFDAVAGENLNAAVIACNTATASCAEKLRQIYPFHIIGIQPAVKPAVARGGRTLALVTPSTAKSKSFERLLKETGGDVTVRACPRLAAYIEAHLPNLPESLPCGLLPDGYADNVVLGCTHYAFVKGAIKKRYNAEIFDGIEGTVTQILKKVGIVNHFEPLVGICDHFSFDKLKITFIGGDIVKNRQVFTNSFVI